MMALLSPLFGVSPRVVRETIERNLERFPNNIDLLSLYTEREARGHVRALFQLFGFLCSHHSGTAAGLRRYQCACPIALPTWKTGPTEMPL